MGSANLIGNVNISGLGFPLDITVTDEGSILQEVTVPKAWAGNLSTRTNATDGVFSTDETHDLDVGDFFDFYFADGVAYDCEVTVEDGDTITFTGAKGTDGDSGDALPLAAVTGQVGERKEINTDFDGDDISCIAASCLARSHLAIVETTGGENVILTQDIPAGQGWFWIEGMGFTNPLDSTDDVDYVWVSQAGTDAARIFNFGVLYDSVS